MQYAALLRNLPLEEAKGTDSNDENVCLNHEMCCYVNTALHMCSNLLKVLKYFKLFTWLCCTQNIFSFKMKHCAKVP